VHCSPRVDDVPLVAGFVDSDILEVAPVVYVHGPSTVLDAGRVAAPAIEEVERVIEEVRNWPKESRRPIHHSHIHAHSHDYHKSDQALEQ